MTNWQVHPRIIFFKWHLSNKSLYMFKFICLYMYVYSFIVLRYEHESVTSHNLLGHFDRPVRPTNKKGTYGLIGKLNFQQKVSFVKLILLPITLKTIWQRFPFKALPVFRSWKARCPTSRSPGPAPPLASPSSAAATPRSDVLSSRYVRCMQYFFRKFLFSNNA